MFTLCSCMMIIGNFIGLLFCLIFLSVCMYTFWKRPKKQNHTTSSNTTQQRFETWFFFVIFFLRFVFHFLRISHLFCLLVAFFRNFFLSLSFSILVFCSFFVFLLKPLCFVVVAVVCCCFCWCCCAPWWKGNVYKCLMVNFYLSICYLLFIFGLLIFFILLSSCSFDHSCIWCLVIMSFCAFALSIDGALCVRECVFVCMSFECVRHVCEYYCLNILVYYHSTYNKRKKNTLRKYKKARNEAHHHCYNTWFHSKTWSSTLVCVYSFVLTVATDGTELFSSLSLCLSLQISLSDLLLSKDLL